MSDFGGTDLPSTMIFEVDVVPLPERQRKRAAYRNSTGAFLLYARHRIPIPKEAESTPADGAVPSVTFTSLGRHMHHEPNDIRRKLLLAGAAWSLLMTSETKAEAQPQAQSRIRFSYDEKIMNILLSPSTGKLIVLGERYHYLFDDKAGLEKIMAASFKKELAGSFGKFTVDGDDVISGSYRIQTRNRLSAEQGDEARRLGLSELQDGRFESAAQISGTRIDSMAIAKDLETSALNQHYVVTVDMIGDARPTPQPDTDTYSAKDKAKLILAILASPVLILMLLFSGPCLVCGNSS